MPKRTAAEASLALFAGPARAAAILGDLTEMAATRGRLWFAAAYLRTLASLAWRPMAAVFAGLASLRIVFWILFEVVRAPSMAEVPRTPLTVFFAIVVAGTAAPVWFVLPFSLVRYGVKDRLTLLSAALFAATAPGFSIAMSHFSLPLLYTAGGLSLALEGAALSSTPWRRAGIVLGATLATGTTALVLFFKILDTAYHFAGQIYPHRNNSSLRLLFGELTTALAMSVAAIACSRLYRERNGAVIPGGIDAEKSPC